MDILVTPHSPQAQRGTLIFGDRRYPCVLGRSGVSAEKTEGDGATPIGRFDLRRVLYRADRLNTPTGPLPATAITAADGWCDAPDDPAYNRPVTLPFAASAETMMRADHLYDIVVVLGHNDDPVIPGAGSAIFLHVMPEDGGPTAGCIALEKNALLDLLAHIQKTTALIVRS